MERVKRKRDLPGIARQLFKGVNVPLLVIEPSHRVIQYVNPAFEDISGRTVAQVKGTHVDRLFSPPSRQKIQAVCELLSGIKKSRLEENECELLRRSGRRVSVNMMASSVSLGTKTWILLSLHDLTHVRKLQKRREMTMKELSQISKLADIGLLAAGVAHELNNPLMIVQGFAENLEILLQRPNVTPTELKRNLSEILHATDRMSRIIGQMSRMVRSTDVKFEIVDLHEVTQNAIRFLAHELKYTEIKISTQFAAQNLVKCDHNQIGQVLMNIVNNAIHALEMRDANREIKITCEQQGAWVELKIWNNGPEIPPAIQDKIMTPFFTTKDVGKGTGLGLAVSFGIMKAHGGGLSFNSDRWGTEFCLRFPLPQVQQVEMVRLPGRCILLVDDDPVVLEMMANKVEAFGFQPLKVRSGIEAFQWLTTEPGVAAVFMNFRLPDMSCVTLSQHIQRIVNPGPPLYVMSDFGLHQHAEKELRSSGVTGFLNKPIEHTAFAEIMNDLNLRNTGAA